MEYRFLGNSGLRVSALSFGSWVTFYGDKDEESYVKLSYDCMKAALDAGCNYFDTAEVYGDGKAEEIMGKVLQKLPVKRSDLVISTKIFWGGSSPNSCGLSRKHIIEGLDASLKRLQLEYVDIVFAHRPDYDTPLEETVRAFNHVINQGKAFYWGTSEWTADQIIQANEIAKRLHLIGPLCEQPQYNMMHRFRFELEYDRLYKEMKLGTTIWSPLASGLLTGKYSTFSSKDQIPSDSRLKDPKFQIFVNQFLTGEGLNGLEITDPKRVFDIVDGLKPIAASLNCSLAQLAIAWCLKNKNVSTVIVGASKPEQVVENFASLEIYKNKLTDDVMKQIETVLNNEPRKKNPYYNKEFKRSIVFPPESSK